MTQQPVDHSLADAICQHLADAVAVPPGHAVASSASAAPSEGWYVRLAVHGRGVSYIWLCFSAKDAATIARRIVGVQPEDLDEGVLRDTLRELVAQSASAVAVDAPGAGLDMQIEAVEASISGLPPLTPRVHAFDIGEGATITLAAWSSPRQEDAPRAAAPAAFSRPDAARSDDSVQSGLGGPENLDLVLDIDLPMSVRFGRTEMALGTLTRLGPGSVIDLGRSPDEPVEMIVSGRVVARGDVVVVGGNFGVRITDVLHTPGRRDL
jgi:flagellar motor switch protein FliN/FliY